MAKVTGTNGDDIIGVFHSGVTTGDDVIFGLGGDDVIYGDRGDDVIIGGAGADHIDGGTLNPFITDDGIDTAVYSDSTEGVGVRLDTGEGFGGTAEGDTLVDIENLTGSLHDDRLLGDDGQNVLTGLDGNDVLKGGGGADVLLGGGGNDNLKGGSGSDTLAGGDGINTMAGGLDNDFYIVDSSADVVVESVGQGTFDQVRTSVTYSLPAGSEIESLITADPDGTAAFDLVGNEFNNTIVGNDGQNTIVGGRGRDTLIGGGGGDVFVWTSTADTGIGANQADVVGADFDPVAGDLLAFNPIDADVTVAGDQAFTFIGGATFTAPGQIRAFSDSTDTFIQLNTDDDAQQEAVVRVTGVHEVDVTWFVL
jgi:Ca2+-binding RTX toxin-like protein